MASEITELNSEMRRQKRNYILIGYGRWGSSVPSLGVPVQWSDISEAKVIVHLDTPLTVLVDGRNGRAIIQNFLQI